MNSFELLGRINWLDCKYTEYGNCVTKIMLAKKKPKSDEYESFPIVFFNTKTDKTAERLAEFCKVGDYIRIKGQLAINRYAPKNADKVQERISLTGWNFVPVEWDSEQNKYIDKEIEEQSA